MLHRNSARNSKDRITLFGSLFLTLVFAGCATPGEIDPAQETIEPDYGAFVFSFDPGVLSMHQSPVHPRWIHLGHGTEVVSIRLHDDGSEVQHFLMEVPADHVEFLQLELVVGDGIVLEHYLSSLDRYLELTRGRISYLGRMTVEDVRFEGGDERSPGTPVDVKIMFDDAFDEDIAELKQHYRLLQRQLPDQRVAEIWSGQEYFVLHEKEWTTRRSGSRWNRSDRAPTSPRRSEN